MKIIQIIYSLCSGGAEKFVVDLSGELAEMGHDVILCMLLDGNDSNLVFNKQFLNSKVKLHSMGFKKGFSLNKCRKVLKFINDENPDIVNCHLNVIPYVFDIALMRKKPAIIHTLHSIASQAGGNRLQYYLNRYFYKKNKIHPVCISKLCFQSYKDYYKLDNAIIIDNGRAEIGITERFKEIKQEVELYKKNEETKVFIHVARFNRAKNQQLLIDSFNKLNSEGIDFILLVIGNGFEDNEASKVKNSACDKIIFLGEKNNVNDYMHCSDAFCLTSIFEGLPISLLEALSCGITPICTAVGGIPDVITDGVNGYLSLTLDVEEYVKTIKRYIQKPMKPMDLIEYYRRNYSMHICAKKYEEQYLHCINV